MAVLINRNPSGRLLCIHALTKTILKKFGTSNAFTINDLKYDENLSDNITDFCDLLIKPTSVNHYVCPYLDNPLSKAKCYLTQSIQLDTQKSKSASDVMNAMDGLGFVSRTSKNAKLTSDGEKFSQEKFDSKSWLSIAQDAVLKYGPFVGLLYEVQRLSKSSPMELKKSEIRLGFPVTNETIRYEGKLVKLSTGSQDDTITRTTSVLFSWATTTGFAVPSDHPIPANQDEWHIKTRDYVEKEKWSASKYKFFIPKNLFDGNHFVENPLHYDWLTKSTRALRERGQDTIRKISLTFEPKVKNRRFALVYILAKCAESQNSLDFKKFLELLKNNQDLFVVNDKEFEKVMATESRIASICGIPFDYKSGMITPLTKLNINKLSIGTPTNVLKELNQILKQL